MSHQRERTGKDCLNCGAEVAGRYCQACGQANIERHMGVWPLIQHFVYDIFHFDGKFFDTVKYLLFRPGYVPLQYVQGRRQSYLDPIRMYLFTSAIFFLLFVLFAPSAGSINFMHENQLSKAERYDALVRYQKSGIVLKDSGISPAAVLMDTGYDVITDVNNNQYIDDDSIYPVQWMQNGKVYAARRAAGSLLQDSALNGLEKGIAARWRRYKEKFDGDTDAMIKSFSGKLFSRFPYLLFLSLPFFAAILKLLYLRRRQFFYFDHAVFTLYHYIFSFMLLLLVLGTDKLHDYLHWKVLSWATALLILSWFIHLAVAMKRFYAQGWGRTVAKFAVLIILASTIMLLLFLGFVLYSAFTI